MEDRNIRDKAIYKITKNKLKEKINKFMLDSKWNDFAIKFKFVNFKFCLHQFVADRYLDGPFGAVIVSEPTTLSQWRMFTRKRTTHKIQYNI